MNQLLIPVAMLENFKVILREVKLQEGGGHSLAVFLYLFELPEEL